MVFAKKRLTPLLFDCAKTLLSRNDLPQRIEPHIETMQIGVSML